MNTEYRRQLLVLKVKIERNIKVAEALTVGEAVDDEILQRATRQLRENRELLRDVEEKLNRQG